MLSNYRKTTLSFLSSFALMAMLFAGNAGIALADNDKDKKDDRKDKTELNQNFKPRINTDFHINSNGKINISGAKVVSVSGSSLVARVSFGSLNMDWTVVTDSNTKISREKNGKTVLSDIKVGDVINVSGTIDTTLSTPTLKASHIKDLTLGAVLTGNLFQGKLVSLTSSTSPATLVLNIGGSNYPVIIPSSISILGNNWLGASLSNFQVGHNIRVYGTLSTSTPTSITASVLRNISL